MIQVKKNIPSEHKCSRCRKDMRKDEIKGGGCNCSTFHKRAASKSGLNIWNTNTEYHGYGDK